MKILLTGNVCSLKKGIDEIADYLGVTIAEGGYTFDVVQKNNSQLSVNFDGKKGSIVYDEPCHFFRAFGLAVEYIKDGKKSFEITESPQFRTNGPMFDLSQGNAAFNVKTFKYIR